MKNKRFFPFFIHIDGRILQPTAMKIWDTLLSDCQIKLDWSTNKITENMILRVEEMSKPLFDELLSSNELLVNKRRSKAQYAYNARRRRIENIGLPEVRNYRLNKLNENQNNVENQILKDAIVLPQMQLLLALRVKEGDR